ncbi:MAG: PEP-CTERM sorting domain-containing protein, partial [Gammaproteobacteria bacterium]
MRKSTFCALLTLAVCGNAAAGPFAPAAGQAGSTAVSKTDPALTAWATGFVNYLPGSSVDAGFQTPSKALGPAVGDSFDTVSLGNAGRITLTFAGTLFNGPGYDFAVFENSFSDNFLELAFVEVSSDGSNFFRFPNFSLTPSAVGAFGLTDPTNLDGYAGKYRQGFGTPFDLDLFKTAAGIDINQISHIRLVDIV